MPAFNRIRKGWPIILLGALVIALGGLSLAQWRVLEQGGQRLILPIDADTAMEIAKADPEVGAFIRENFTDPANRLEKAFLVKEPSGYLWKVELMERVCGCQGLSSISIAEVLVDPETGEVMGRQLRAGVPETQRAKESCAPACHQ